MLSCLEDSSKNFWFPTAGRKFLKFFWFLSWKLLSRCKKWFLCQLLCRFVQTNTISAHWKSKTKMYLRIPSWGYSAIILITRTCMILTKSTLWWYRCPLVPYFFVYIRSEKLQIQNAGDIWKYDFICPCFVKYKQALLKVLYSVSYQKYYEKFNSVIFFVVLKGT